MKILSLQIHYQQNQTYCYLTNQVDNPSRVPPSFPPSFHQVFQQKLITMAISLATPCQEVMAFLSFPLSLAIVFSHSLSIYLSYYLFFFLVVVVVVVVGMVVVVVVGVVVVAVAAAAAVIFDEYLLTVFLDHLLPCWVYL